MERLAADVRENVETTTMRHSHDDGLDAEAGRCIDDFLHGWNHDFASLQAEALLRHELLGEESFETDGDG